MTKIKDNVIRKILSLRESGKVIREISEATGLSQTTVWKVVCKNLSCKHRTNHNIPDSDVEKICAMRASGMTVNEIAESTGISYNKVNYALYKEGVVKGSRKSKLPRMYDIVNSLRGEGKTYQEIANVLNITRQRAHQIASTVVDNQESHAVTNEEIKEFYTSLVKSASDIVKNNPNLSAIGKSEIHVIKEVIKELTK